MADKSNYIITMLNVIRLTNQDAEIVTLDFSVTIKSNKMSPEETFLGLAGIASANINQDKGYTSTSIRQKKLHSKIFTSEMQSSSFILWL